MTIYIVSAGYEYTGIDIKEVFDSADKAKEFCFDKYGIDCNDWTLSNWDNGANMKDYYFFYDPKFESEKKLKTNYTDFRITVRKVK